MHMIKDHFDVDQWQYLLLKSNPAGYGSKGLDRIFSVKVKMWYDQNFSGSHSPHGKEVIQ